MKREKNYFKGEWEARQNKSFSEVNAKEGENTLGVNVICLDVDYENITKTEVATAHLIASAPDLLEALEELMKGIEGLPSLASISGVLEDQYKKAEKAIAKAYGEGCK